MASLKEFTMAASLCAATALSGCASSTPTSYQGSGSLFNPQKATAQQQQNKVPEGMLVRRDFNGLKAEFCDVKDQFVRTKRGTEYCFDKNDVKYVMNNNLIAGQQLQYQGPQYAQQMWDQFRNQMNRGIESRGRSSNSTIQLGRNGKGGVNMANSFMKIDEYKRSCFNSFAFRDENQNINGVLRESPAQLGTFDNCVNKLRMKTTIHRTGPITINF
jgi:hypothetical protein|tara:strand:+ start:60825 stop:61472 length:648 start_codon:yes stop_codon:yes gene_type:complete